MGGSAGARVQTASIAVGATVSVMVLALVASSVISRGDGSQRVATTPAEVASARSTRDIAAPPTTAPPGRQPTRAGAPAGAPTTPPVGDTAAGSPVAAGAGQTSVGTPTSSPVHASGEPRVAAPPEPQRLELRAAKAGSWYAEVHMSQRSVVDGSDEEDDFETWVRAFEPEGSTQRLEAQPAWQAFSDERAGYDETGRRLHQLDLAGGATTTVFRSEEGFLEVPRVFRAGDSWTWSGTSDDGKSSMEATIRAIKRTTVELVDGDEVDAVEYDLDARISGDRSLRVQRRVWFAVDLGVPARVEERMTQSDVSGSTAERTSTFRLVRAEPEAPPVVESDVG